MQENQQEYQNIATSALKESPLNPRRTFDKKAIEELEKSIRETGKVLTPLLVRPNGTGSTYEVLAGARRLRCAVKIGLETVPVRVLDGLSDAQAQEIRVIENLQRADVHPLEEAQGFQALLQMAPALDGANYAGKAETDRKLKIQDIAKKVGMSQEYVYGRLKLLELAPVSTKLLQAGKIEAGHAILLARLEPDDQAAIIKNKQWQITHGRLSVRELAEHISYQNQQKKWKAEAAARKKKEAAERKSGKGSKQKSWREQEEEQNRKYEAGRAAQDLKRKAETKARVATVEAIFAKVKWPLPKGVFRMLAGDLAGKLKESEIPLAIIGELCARYEHDWPWDDCVQNVKMLANIYGVKRVKPEVLKPESVKSESAEPEKSAARVDGKKKKLQTSAKSSKKAVA